MELSTKLQFDTILHSPNLAEKLSKEDQDKIGLTVWEEWDIDKNSRSDWEDRMKSAFGLALQVMDKKTFPWPGAANVKFPLVTIAALQYHARAYPALIPGPEIVRCRAYGDDPQGMMSEQANRISSHMSYQVLEEDEEWEDDMDRVLLSQAIVGCAFKKTYFSPRLGHNRSEHVFAKDLYIHYYAKNLKEAQRITQVLYFSRNDLEERRRNGLFLEWETSEGEKPPVTPPSYLDDARDDSQGVHFPSNDPSTPFKVLEQHRWLDLDGDGFNEPYVVFVREDNRKLLRIVARFRDSNVKRNQKNEIYAIEPDHYFTKYTFIPSPDGGIYDLGFGSLLAPLNESINSSINLLIDSGTVANTAGGFLGRGVKFRSGETTFKPWEWKRVDSTGDDLRKGIVPLPVREPSNVVFLLLKLLIDYGERVGMATDPQVGVPTGQNTPAETSRNMIMEGQRVFSAIFKRTYRSLKEEFRKLYRLNRTFLQDRQEYFMEGANKSALIFRADYSIDEKLIVPAADPNMTSEAEKVQQAMMLKQSAMTTPGYNRDEIEKRFLRAMKVSDMELVFPGSQKVPPPPNPKVAVEMMKLESKKLKMQMDMQFKIAKLMQDAELQRAKILELEAKAAKEIAEADGVEAGHKIAALEAMVGAAKVKQEGIFNSMNILKEMYQHFQEGEQQNATSEQGPVPGMDAGPGNEGTNALPR